jgi:hypothetical protein
VIFYGKNGDLATNRRYEQEMSVLCLRILQAALVYVNTLTLQDILADPDWEDAPALRTKGEAARLVGSANQSKTRSGDAAIVRSTCSWTMRSPASR